MAVLRVRTLISLAAAAMLIQLATAANFTVGGPNGGWDMATDLKTWATSQRFVVGDNLIFQYLSSHDVREVSKPDYDSCQAINAIQSHSNGNTIIALSSPGKRYFICGIPGHCIAGMKVEIDTLATTSTAPASTPPQASPAAPAPQVSPLTPPPASLTPETPSPSLSPASPAPETSSPSPAESPKSSPTVSPVSPSSSPLSSPPPSPGLPTADSPSTSLPPIGVAPPPQPSSALKVSFKTTLVMGFNFGITMLLAF